MLFAWSNLIHVEIGSLSVHCVACPVSLQSQDGTAMQQQFTHTSCKITSQSNHTWRPIIVVVSQCLRCFTPSHTFSFVESCSPGAIHCACMRSLQLTAHWASKLAHANLNILVQVPSPITHIATAMRRISSQYVPPMAQAQPTTVVSLNHLPALQILQRQ